MALRLVRVDENATVCKAVFPEGTSYIGRGRLLDCEDKRVSRKHAELYVMDECIYIKSMHSKNPCFIKKKNSENIIVVNYEERFPLNNGDRIGFLPDNYWYKIMSLTSEALICKEEPRETNDSLHLYRNNTEPLDFDDSTQTQAINTPTKNNQSTQDSDAEKAGTSWKRPHDSLSPARSKAIKKEPITPSQPPNTSSDTIMNVSSHAENSEANCDTQTALVKTEPGDERSTSREQSSPTAVLQNGASSSPLQSAAQNNTTVRARCKYGVSCYRKNPFHLQEFSHPDDLDWDADRCSATQEHRKGGKRRRERSTSSSSDSQNTELIITGKRSRKTIARAQWSDSDNEDPYKTDGSDDWMP